MNSVYGDDAHENPYFEEVHQKALKAIDKVIASNVTKNKYFDKFCEFLDVDEDMSDYGELFENAAFERGLMK